uniref:Uncharacterized protein n=2 Tax=Bursaphelenchus xylophilus TaxID=6326 RepID=A0A1I7SB15_BURXY
MPTNGSTPPATRSSEARTFPGPGGTSVYQAALAYWESYPGPVEEVIGFLDFADQAIEECSHSGFVSLMTYPCNNRLRKVPIRRLYESLSGSSDGHQQQLAAEYEEYKREMATPSSLTSEPTEGVFLTEGRAVREGVRIGKVISNAVDSKFPLRIVNTTNTPQRLHPNVKLATLVHITENCYQVFAVTNPQPAEKHIPAEIDVADNLIPQPDTQFNLKEKIQLDPWSLLNKLKMEYNIGIF